MTKHNTQDWREEYEKLFNNASFTWNGDNYSGIEMAKRTNKKMKSFISNLLTSQLNSLIAELEEKKKQETPFSKYHVIAFNQGISDAQIIIRGKIEKK